MLILISLLLLATSSKCSPSKFDLNTNKESDVVQDGNRSVDSFIQCPAWFRHTVANDSQSCGCGETINPGRVTCTNTTNLTSVFRTFCVTYDNDTDSVVAGYCPYNFIAPDYNRNTWITEIPPLKNFSELDDIMCGPLNRTGMLCSKCQPGLGPAVLSYSGKCVKCLDSRYSWFVYVLAALVPTTLLCVVIMVFHIDGTSPSMNMFILMCQLIVNQASITSQFLVFENRSYGALMLTVLSFYGIWNLDFFRAVLPPFCISSDMSALQVIALDYVVAAYPLVLTAVMYYCIEYHDRGCKVLVFLWRPFHRHLVRFKRTWNVKGSVVNAFATFVLLSYCKLLFLSYGLLHYTTVYGSCGQMLNKVLAYYDARVSLFRGEHLPYALLAICVLVFLIVLPLVYILFYQNRLFKKFLSVCKLETALLSELANVSQRSFKNGIDGASDLRWFAGVYLIFRISYCLSYPFNPPVASLLIILLGGVSALTCALLQPHQKRLYNILDSTIFAIMCYTCTYVAIAHYAPELNMSFVPVGIVFVLPLVLFLCLVTYKLILIAKTLKCCQDIIEKGTIFYLKKQKTPEATEDVLPYRLSHPSEYTPLLSPTENVTASEVHVYNEIEAHSTMPDKEY